MQVSHERNHHIGLLLITCLMAGIGLYAARLPAQQAQQGHWVGHTRQVLLQLDTLARHLTETEAGQRGYLLTGQAVYLSAYKETLNPIAADLAHLQQLTADNVQQQAQLSRLRAEVAEKLAFCNKTVDLRQKLHPKAAVGLVASGHGRRQMAAIRQRIEHMQAVEQRLLQQRTRQWQAATSQTYAVILGGGMLMYLLICMVYVVLCREARQRKRWIEAERQTAMDHRAEAERLAQIVAVQHEVAWHRLDLQAAMETITERTQVLTGADGCVIEMLEGMEMVYRAASGTAARYIGLRLKAETSLSGRCAWEQVVLRCEDTETDDRVDRDACRKVGLRSMVVVPLSQRGQAVGVLKVLSSQVNAFTERDVATLELMAGVLSATMRDAVAANTIQAANEWLTEANAALVSQKMKLESANVQLEALATTDGLTGLKNHRTFQERLAHEYQRARRYGTPLSLVLLDVDHFKDFNDTFGHPAGDAILQRVAALLQTEARVTDCLARYGGEEFALLLPETDAQGAVSTAERIRQLIAGAVWEQRAITVSVGAYTLDATIESAAHLVEAADKALYQSKTEGRNRVTHRGGALLLLEDGIIVFPIDRCRQTPLFCEGFRRASQNREDVLR
jgi:diguanylate cyclase